MFSGAWPGAAPAGLLVRFRIADIKSAAYEQTKIKDTDMRTASAWLIGALLLCGVVLPAFGTCPVNSIGSALPSAVYGYVTVSSVTHDTCVFKTLEEAEYYARQPTSNGNSAPALSLAFPVVGALDLPSQGSGYLDYRPGGANSSTSSVLYGPPAVVNSTYAIFEPGWPPTSVPSACAGQVCTTGWCNTFADEVNRVQCEFDATWGTSKISSHPGMCWTRQSSSSSSNFTRLASIIGANNPSGTLTFGPQTSSSNDSGASISITAASCGNETAEAVSPAATAAESVQSSPAAVDGKLNSSPAATTTASMTKTWGAQQKNDSTCGSGYFINGSATGMSNACSSSLIKVTISPPSQQNTSGQCGVGNPCFPSNGNKEVVEPGFNYGHIPFDLYYNSMRQTRPYAYIDENWSHTYAKRVLTEWAGPNHISSPDTAALTSVSRMVVQDEEAHVETYLQEAPSGSGVFRSTNTIGRILRWYPQSGSSPPFWELYYPDGTINVFDRAGRLIQIDYPDDPAKSLTLSYMATFNGTSESTDTAHHDEPFWRLVQVRDGTARAINFMYSTSDQYYWLSSIVADDNVTTLMSFGYANPDSLHRLTTTTQFSKTRTYLYNEPANIGVTSSAVGYWLTGITDELNQRYATYKYDAWGRVTDSWHGTDAGKVSVAYRADASGNPIDGQATATLPSGAQQIYTYPSSEPYRHASTIANTATGAPTTTRNFTYDDAANGTSLSYRMLTSTDANGNTTKFEYDSNWAHQTAVTKAFGAPQQRRTETDWDPSTNRITAQRIYSDPSGGTRTLLTTFTYSYDVTTGHLKSKTQTDPTTLVTRVWTYNYCPATATAGCVPGFLQSVDGPRTDVADTTTYTYYTSTDLSGCTNGNTCHYAGDVQKVTNAVGQATTYTRSQRSLRRKLAMRKTRE